jgi:hypothetical protein
MYLFVVYYLGIGCIYTQNKKKRTFFQMAFLVRVKCALQFESTRRCFPQKRIPAGGQYGGEEREANKERKREAAGGRAHRTGGAKPLSLSVSLSQKGKAERKQQERETRGGGVTTRREKPES